jgi:hypothetical protein
LVPAEVEDAKEQSGIEAIGARPQASGIADDGATPRLADASAADYVGWFFHAEEDLEEEVSR